MKKILIFIAIVTLLLPAGCDNESGSDNNTLMLFFLGSNLGRPTYDTWSWVSGSNTVNQSGTYGTKGVAHSANIPGARYDSVSWIVASGNLWLFGGYGFDSTGNSGRLNDLWRCSP